MNRPLLLVVFGALALLALHPAAAQGIEGPLLDRAGRKVDDAREDPQGYTTEQTREEQLRRDANWTVAYGCYVAHHGADAAGVPLPELEPCADYESAIGGVPPPQDEPVAVAEPYEEQVVDHVDLLAEDALDTVEAIVADPADAPNALLAFLARTARNLERLVGTIGDLLEDVLRGIGLGARLVGLAAWDALVAPFVGAAWLAAQGAALATNAGHTFADGTTAALTGTVDAIETGLDAVQDAIASLFDGQRDDATTPPRTPLNDPTAPTRDALDPVTRLLDETTAPVTG